MLLSWTRIHSSFKLTSLEKIITDSYSSCPPKGHDEVAYRTFIFANSLSSNVKLASEQSLPSIVYYFMPINCVI